MNKEQKILRNNIIAIKAAHRVNANPELLPNNQDAAEIRKFGGWGGVKSLLYPIDQDWKNIPNIKEEDLEIEKDIRELHAIIEEYYPQNKNEIINSIKNSILTSFYTPEEIPNLIFEKLQERNESNISKVLDPCAGGGVYIDNCIKHFPKASITGVEKDFLTAEILKAKYKDKKNIVIINKPFEETDFGEVKFDVIASNIPFGDITIFDENVPKEFTRQIHNYFFFKCQSLLNEGAYMSLITSTGVFDAPTNAPIREVLARNGKIGKIFVLPENLFKDSDMSVNSHLIEFVKTDYQTQEEKQENNILAKSILNEEGVKINKWINDFKFSAYAKTPILKTNQFGELKYSYRCEKEDLISHLKEYIDIPKLEIEPYEIYLEDPKLNFESFPEAPLNSYINNPTKDLNYIKNQEVVKSWNKWETVGAVMGNYRGKRVPFVVFTKLKEKEESYPTYYVETFTDDIRLKDHLFNNRLLKPKEFNELSIDYFNKLYEVAEQFQIKMELDFKINQQGYKLFNYFVNKYENPELKVFYTDEESIISHHNEIKVGDLTINENNNISVITDIIIDEGKKIYKTDEIPIDSKRKEIIRKLLNIYSRTNILNKAIQQKEDIERPLYLLNKTYDEFYETYGFINELKLNPVTREIVKNYLPLLKSLEIENQKENNLFQKSYIKSDLFNWKTKMDKELEVSPNSALIRSIMEENKVDIDYIKSLTRLNTDEDVYQALKDYIIFSPIENQYVLIEDFLKGNLYNKLEIIEKISDDNIYKLPAKRFLENALPNWIDFREISINPGSRWLDIKYLNQFAEEYFRINYIKLFYDNNNDNLSVEVDRNQFNYNSIRLNNGRYLYPEQIISNAFYDLYPKVTSDGKIDFQSTQFLKKEINKFKKAFDVYMKDIPNEEKQTIEKLYNHKFNSKTKIEFKGELLDVSEAKIENLNIKEIYKHQKDAAWKMIMNKGGIVDHSVGFGKTLTMVMQTYYMKKLNIVKKPILLALPTNVGEISIAYKKLFPNAKVLFASQKDYAKRNREVFLNRIMTNDWDLVVMSHDQFQAIPPDKKVEIEILEEEIEDLENNILNLENKGYDSKIFKKLEKKKESLINKMKRKKAEQKKDENVLSFDKLGIDHIVIDESHNYKNLAFQTQHSQVPGIGNTEGSKKCDYLLTAIRSIQRKNNSDFGASFYSGTPISNSLTELYILFKYLIPNELNDMGIKNFDSWASVFAEKTAEFEVNIVNQVQSKERFRYYNNLPELASIYENISHVMHGDNKNIDRPDMQEEFLVNEQSPLQQRFNHKLLRFLQTGDQSVLDLDTPLRIGNDENTALSLLATNLAFKASVDMRLINNRYPDERRSKINTLIDRLMENYHKFQEQKGTMLIFSEIGVSKKNLSFQEMEENYNNNIFTSVYDDIKYKLIKRGVKENEIAFIQNYKTDKQKSELSKKMNAGEIRVLIGNTKNAGTGLNIQKRLVYIDHLTIPWNPAYINQRNGRIHRAGNWICKNYNNNKALIGYSVTKNTLDEYRVDLNKTKEGFINQIRNKTNQRNVDEGELDEKLGMNLAQLQAVLSGDNTLLEKTKIDKQIIELEDDREFVNKQNRIREGKIKKAEERIKSLDYIIEKIETDKNKYEKNVIYDDKNVRVNNPSYLGLENKNVTEFLEEEWRNTKKLEDNIEHKVGELYGFDLMMQSSFLEGAKAYIKNPSNPGVTYIYKDGILDFRKPEEVERYYLNCFNSIGRRLESNKKNIEEEKNDLLKIQNSKPLVFDKAEKLEELEGKLEEILISLEKTKGKRELLLDKIYSEEVKTEIVNIDKEEDLQKILCEDYFRENNVEAAFGNHSIAGAFQALGENSKHIDLLQNKYNSNTNLNFIKFEILDADLLYIDFMKMKENGIIDQYKEMKVTNSKSLSR